MAALDQATINLILSDSRFIAAFPALATAKRKIAELSQRTQGSGCCGDAAPDPTASVRPILSELKRTIATWRESQVAKFLGLLNQRSMQITYRDPAKGTTVTVVISR